MLSELDVHYLTNKSIFCEKISSSSSLKFSFQSTHYPGEFQSAMQENGIEKARKGESWL